MSRAVKIALKIGRKILIDQFFWSEEDADKWLFLTVKAMLAISDTDSKSG